MIAPAFSSMKSMKSISAMVRRLAAAVGVLLVTACASPREAAYTGTALDAGSTAIGLSQGFTEANPLGFPAALIAKIGLTEYINANETGAQRTDDLFAVAASSSGFGVANLALLAGLPPPFNLIAGTAVGLAYWHSTAQQREGEHACERHIAFFHLPPDTPCMVLRGPVAQLSAQGTTP